MLPLFIIAHDIKKCDNLLFKDWAELVFNLLMLVDKNKDMELNAD